MSLRFIRGVSHRGEALGRSRGGLGTKIVGVCDAVGRLVDFLLAPSLTLMRRLPDAPSWALADMACDAKEFRSEMRAMGAIPVVPSRRGAKEPQPCPAYIYRHRNLIERCWSRLKERRAVATRYDKTAASYAAGVAIAASLDWINASIRQVKIKGRYRPMRGFKCPRSAARFCRGYDELRNFLRPQSRHNQHVPADHRRLRLLRRTTTVLAILEAA